MAQRRHTLSGRFRGARVFQLVTIRLTMRPPDRRRSGVNRSLMSGQKRVIRAVGGGSDGVIRGPAGIRGTIRSRTARWRSGGALADTAESGGQSTRGRNVVKNFHFTHQQALALARRSGMVDVDLLASCVKDCGFDEQEYLERNNLDQVGFDSNQALFHFLTEGLDERRSFTCAPLPVGLAGFSSLKLPDRGYAARLFRNLFQGQLSNPATADSIWQSTDGGLIDAILANGGLPYVVFGDSHASHYMRRLWVGDIWFAPLCFVCNAASARGLANEASLTGHGARILQWARTPGHQNHDIPIFFKFGGIDAEYLWILHRLRHGIRQFSIAEFEHFARLSVTRYADLFDQLCQFIDPGRLRICAVFPSALVDSHWIDSFVRFNAGTPEHAIRLAAELHEMELPDLLVRTRLRAFYNAILRAMSEAKGLVFVDDFTPMLGQDGILDRRFLPRDPNDHHLDHTASEKALVTIILTHAYRRAKP
jgi:hypothetical protein